MNRAVTYQPSEADLLGAYRDFNAELLRRRGGVIAGKMALFAGVVGALSTYPFRSLPGTLAVAAAFALGGVLLWGASYLLCLRRLRKFARTSFQQNRSLRHPYGYDWSEGGIAYRGESSSGAIRWSDMHRVHAGERALLFYQSDTYFHYLPLRTLAPDQQADLRRLMAGTAPAR